MLDVLNYVPKSFAYDVIHNMIMQTMINWLQILIWPYNVSLYQI